MKAQKSRGTLLAFCALIALVFGALTLKEGGTVLFGSEAARQAAGQYVPFVLWFNFLAGFAYIVAGAGLWWRQRWAAWLAISLAAATLLVFAVFLVHIGFGGAWEQRTFLAMIFRSVLWLAIAAVGRRQLLRPRSSAA